jgi:hypothetical protein
MQFKSLSSAAALAAAMAISAPASAASFSFDAVLNGNFEVPAVPTTAQGLAFVTFDDVAFTVSVTDIFIGLTGGPATAAHIHCCTTNPGTGTAPVVVPFTGFPATTSGAYTNVFTLAAPAFNSLLLGAFKGDAYVNIHNATYPGGEIQGFLHSVSVVPEPQTYALMFAGLGVIGLLAARRRRS